MTEGTTKLPDWSTYSSDDKLNLLLDMSYKNSVNIQNVSQTLDSHTVDIKNLVANFKENNEKLNQLSSSLDAVNNSLAEITKAQELAQNEIKKLTNDLNKNAIKCNENTASINLLKSTIDSLANSTHTQHTNDHHSSSQLLFSGIPDTLNNDLSADQIIHSIFETLGTPNLTNDILNIREFKNKKRQGSSNDTSNLHAFIVKLKSQEICEHIIEVKRRSSKLLIKNIFKTYAGIDRGKQ
ncbi:hypothetical protein KQX54_008211, partial [Cotesia glomerata]